MKKSIKIFITLIFFIILLSIGKSVKANSINKISMDIFIDSNGTAQVTETWNCSANQGTEVYHPYYNLGNSKITNLVVSENGQNYTTLNNWNTSGTFESKAYKCGINYVSDGLEICWGISKYGAHTYIVKYNITNFVSELSDAQMVYWTLIPHNFSNTIGSVNIKIYSNFKYSNTLDVWGYGDYGAPTYVSNGYIEMHSKGKLKSNEYMTILVKFPKGTFKTTNILDHNFDYYYNMAQKGAVKYNKNTDNNINTFWLNYWVAVIIILTGSLILMYFIKKIKIKLQNKPKREIKIERKSLNKVKKTDYYRNIPCQSDLFRAYYIAYQYGLIKNKTDILGALILKWIKENIIKIEKIETKGRLKKEDNVLIIPLERISEKMIPNYNERKIFENLRMASEDGILEKNELKKWCQKNCEEIFSWFYEILKEQKDLLIEKGYIISQDQRSIFGKRKKYVLTEANILITEAEELSGFKKYLLDYSWIPEREAIEVKLFEEYLVYAQMLGIAKKVAKQFKNLYPDIIEQSNYNNFDNILFIDDWTSNGITVAYNAQYINDIKERAERYSSSGYDDYSSGGGGYSSGGGGDGSFGGGSSGGGGFR